MCGKYQGETVWDICSEGSPPRVREVYLKMDIALVHIGITPACAGSIRSHLHRNFQARDHPRVCGKYPYFFILLNMFAGSPPRVREVLSLKNVIIRASGITPPRVCGKYKTIKKRNGRTTGITPACAGSMSE